MHLNTIVLLNPPVPVVKKGNPFGVDQTKQKGKSPGRHIGSNDRFPLNPGYEVFAVRLASTHLGATLFGQVVGNIPRGALMLRKTIMMLLEETIQGQPLFWGAEFETYQEIAPSNSTWTLHIPT